jgi:hypothetical protein
MPKFIINIERIVPEYRERAEVVVVADSVEDIQDNFDYDILNEIELDWQEVMEGHGGFVVSNEIENISELEEEAKPDMTTNINFSDLKVGAEVYWNDPDEDQCSGYYKISKIINDEIVVLEDGKKVFVWELSYNELE